MTENDNMQFLFLPNTPNINPYLCHHFYAVISFFSVCQKISLTTSLTYMAVYSRNCANIHVRVYTRLLDTRE